MSQDDIDESDEMHRMVFDDDHGDHRDDEVCWHCHGEGGFHDCGEDCCACLEPDLNEQCPECNGEGRL